jgi:type I restriction enzyme R subunit
MAKQVTRYAGDGITLAESVYDEGAVHDGESTAPRRDWWKNASTEGEVFEGCQFEIEAVGENDGDNYLQIAPDVPIDLPGQCSAALHTGIALEIAEPDTLRERLRTLPGLDTHGLWGCQVEAIRNLERSFAQARPRALIQMATGSGKTFTSVSFIYRLIKYANARRVLFLVDRRTLGKQTNNEFQQYAIPQDGRKFTQVYNVQHLTSNAFDPVSRVTISTIQRLYSMLRGEELPPELEEESAFQLSAADDREREVVYNPAFPIETFDFIVTDECHRSIYNLWRQVLEYFDAFTIGLTATPSKQTFGFFNQNLVMEYPHERAVADGVNVGYDVYRIRTGITEGGSSVPAGFYVDKRSKLTRERRWEQLDDDLQYAANQLDRDVVAEDQIRTVIGTFRDKLFEELFPGRTEVPKTLIFAKDDSHAEDIVHIVREEFGKGNDFCKKITYRTTGESTDSLIQSFRNSYNPRIAVTVDMISTGTDVKPLECLLFMRDVRSRVYFDQMKGRGTRVINPTDLQSVTPDAVHKTHFVVVDAIGVTETDKTDTRPLERKRSVPFDQLLLGVALGKRDEDMLTSLAGRLARLDREVSETDRADIEKASGGTTLHQMVNGLLDAVDPDAHLERARALFNTAEPSGEQVKQAAAQLAEGACQLFDSAELRARLLHRGLGAVPR